MARKTREISKSGIYHVILRGVNKQRIFEQSEDYDAIYRIFAFVRTFDTERQQVDSPNYFLYAYCIMDNHIHLLIQPNNQPLGNIMTRIMTTYALYFNNTYERVGHLFQDRYKSEVVEDADYFFTLLHYIHQNPVKAGLCEHPSNYPYCSYKELYNLKTDEKGLSPFVSSPSSSLCYFPELSSLLDIEQEYHRHAQAMFDWEEKKTGPKPQMKTMNILGISPIDIRDAVLSQEGIPSIPNLFARVKKMVQGSDTELCRQIRVQLNWQTAEEKDSAIVSTLLEMTGVNSISEFQRLDKPTLRTALAIVRDSGVGDTKLSRLTGVSRGVIQRASIYPCD